MTEFSPSELQRLREWCIRERDRRMMPDKFNAEAIVMLSHLTRLLHDLIKEVERNEP